MKFTNGYWLLQKDIKGHYPAQIHQVEISGETVTIYAPTKTILQRGDTLNGPVLTIQLSSPMPDVIRIKMTHLSGAGPKMPQFEILETKNHTATIQNDSEITALTSGNLTAGIHKNGPWKIQFSAGGETLTSSGPRGMGIIEKDDRTHFMHEQLSLAVGENIYGLGERFSAFVKNGQAVDIWNEDGGTSSEQAYKNIPFYMSSNGYGVFVNHPEKVSFEIASEKMSQVQFSVPGQYLEYFIIYGPTPKEILKKYTALTGKPSLPPAWSFGLWLSTSFTTSYDEETVTRFIREMAEHDLPLGVFHFDCFWMKEYHWCDFKWEKNTFPDPLGMLKRLKEHGLKICLWINPYIAQASELFEEGKENGYLLKKPNGDVWQTDMWQPGMGIVDFTNPDARRWYGDKLRALVKMGVDCFKSDFGERIPTDVVYWDGSDPQKMHNYYSFLYNQTVFNVLEKEQGVGNAIVFARAATAGCQQFPVHWGGDCESTFESMAESLRGGLSLGLSGFGFWSHDIGGFEGTPPAAVYKRWAAFGLLSSHSRLHGSQSYRVPWLFDEEAVAVVRKFTLLKHRLMPTIFGHALEARDSGLPVMRAMLLEFPHDPTCLYLDRQYMFGSSLLVAPIFSEDGKVRYYLPAGRWTHFLTGQVRTGPGWVEEQYDFLSLPLWVRPNSVIALGARDRSADYDYGQDVTLQAYELSDGPISTIIPTQTGQVDMVFNIRQTGKMLSVTRTGNKKPWQFKLMGVDQVLSMEGGQLENTPEGVLVKMDAAAEMLRIYM